MARVPNCPSNLSPNMNRMYELPFQLETKHELDIQIPLNSVSRQVEATTSEDERLGNPHGSKTNNVGTNNSYEVQVYVAKTVMQPL